MKTQRLIVVSVMVSLGLAGAKIAKADVEPIDGTGNNVDNPTWGSAGSDLLRIAPAGYADGIDSPSLPGDLSARDISNVLNDQADPSNPSVDVSTVDGNSLSDFGYAFGQFMDHDMDLTPDGGASFPIPVASNDPIGPDPLDFTRSQTDPATGTTTPAQQVNVITSYFDLSQVYGSSQVVADALRTFTGGLMKTSPGNMLPYDNTNYFTADQVAALNMANDAQVVPEDQLFAAGDVRGNENIELTALVTLFVRNHNRLAGIFQKEHPNWSDEQLYQEARKINIAQYQNIIYAEWIPAVLGPHALRPYREYNPNVNASIANEFSTVAFRFGHSMVSPSIARDGNNGQALDESISLAFDFFDPNLLNPSGTVDPLTGLAATDIGPILKADADGNGQAMDNMAISDIRNLLFGNGGLGGDDLIARDAQRGRDNGIPDYNTLRISMGLPAVTSFKQITNNQMGPAAMQFATGDLALQQQLAEAYPGGVGTVDAFEGGVCEYPVPGSDVGPTFQAIMVDQFTRLRDGDRFFYLNEVFNADEMKVLQQTCTLAQVIMANTNVTNIQSDAIFFRASISGTVSVMGGRNGSGGITVNLEDTSSDILATTTTDRQGNYSFNQQSGPAGDSTITPGVSATGVYQIVVVIPPGLRQVSNNPPSIQISRGDTAVTGVNFSLSSPTPPPPPVRMPPPRGPMH
jgi:peroxidase